MSRLSVIGVGPPSAVGIGESPTGGAAPEPNPNLLLWSEEFQQAAWVKTGVAVVADTVTDPLAGSTADALAFDPEGSVQQSSSAAAAAGATANETKSATGSWQRFSVSGTFDGSPYTFSIYAKDSTGVSLVMSISRAGGVLVATVRNPDDVAGFGLDLWGAKLEQSATATAYVKREGT